MDRGIMRCLRVRERGLGRGKDMEIGLREMGGEGEGGVTGF